MSSNLVMVLTGPLQSWGGPTPGVYERPTQPMPTLSGVVGILANALGYSRTEDITELASGRLAVRADRPGVREMDYHTIGSGDRVAPVADRKQKGRTIPTERQYLADAAFLVVYMPPSDSDVDSERLLAALNWPKRPLYLGRRSCPPAAPIGVGVTDTPFAEVIRTAAILRDPPRHRGQFDDGYYYDAQDETAAALTVPIQIEYCADEGDIGRSLGNPDRPGTFDPRRLYHRLRPVIRDTLHLPASLCAGRGHDGLRQLHETLGVVR